MRSLECVDSAISCGIYEVYGFDCLQSEENDKKILADLRDLRLSFARLDRDFDYDEYDNNYAPECCMFLAALADFQWEKWDPILRKNGWTCVTRKGTEPINPNSSNKNRLYVLKRPAPPKPKKAKVVSILPPPVVEEIKKDELPSYFFPRYLDDSQG